MAHNAAFHCSKEHFERLVLPDEFPGVGLFLCHIDRKADRTHNTAVEIIQRGLVSGKSPHSFPGLNDLFRDIGFSGFHNDALGLNTCRIILFHIPYIGMASAFHLGFALPDCCAEAVVYFFVNTVFIFKPDQIGRAVDGALQIMAGLPEILTHLIILLPAPEAEAKLIIRHRERPDIPNGGQAAGYLCNLPL